MDERKASTDLDRQIGDWLRDERSGAAPGRLVEDVFARTTATRQVRRPLIRWSREGGRSNRRPAALLAAAALLALGVIGSGPVGSLLGGPPATRPSPTPAASPVATPRPADVPLEVLRTFRVCVGYPSLTLIPGPSGAASAAWVTCGANSVEVQLDPGVVVDRPGIGVIAVDGLQQWAIKGSSVVKLAADRSITATFAVGTPTSVAVLGTTVFALDTETGAVSAHGANGIAWSVVPAPGGRPVALAVAGGSVWVLAQGAGTLIRLDPQDGRVLATVVVGPGASKLAVAAGALYATNPPNSTTARVDPLDGSVRTIALNVPLSDLQSIGGSPDGLLVVSQMTIYRADPLTGVLGNGGVSGNYVGAVALDRDRLLIATEDAQLVEARAP